jgi:ribonucleoside-diphosphate reductase alpha chain
LKDKNGNIIETPKQMFRRVAREIAKADLLYNKRADIQEIEEEFYQMMENLEFLPNSPCLMNAGTEIGQLSACFVLPVEDSIESIFDAVKNMALIQKSGGGTGFSFSKLRPSGDIVGSTMGVASGPVSFMRIFDTATDVIKQGGKRRGANMGILSVHHPDIVEFITSKEKEGVLTNFNISVAVTDKFMEAVQKNEEYELINPRTNEVVEKMNARDVFNLIVTTAWKTGDPGLIFIDEINRHNPTPHIGTIESTNPCIPAHVFVMTDNGPRQVADLIGKKFVAVINNERWESSEDGFFQTGIKPVYKLITREGFEVYLTKNHPIMKIKRATRYRIETEWVQAQNLKKGDKILLNNNKRMNSWNGEFTFEEGYLVGLLLGDGTIKKDKAVLSSWGETKGKKAVREFVYAYAKKMPHRSDFNGWIHIKNRSEYRMSFIYLNKLLKKLGLESRKKKITVLMEKVSSDFCRGLIRGLFDSDGSVQGSQRKGVSIRLAQSDLEILKVVQRILLRFGIYSKIYANRREYGFSKMPNGKGGIKDYPHKPQHELVISNESIEYFNRKIGFGDLEKRERLEQLIKNYKRKINREYFIATVEDFIFHCQEEVFDVKIPGINAFDANGFIVHNCGEQPLLPYESCNLGSINLAKMVKDGKIDWEKLRKTVRSTVHFLDNVIDVNKFPLPEIEKMTKANRKIGLGVMGFADMLIELGIPYNSEEGIKTAEEVMKFITEEARKKSVELGIERGSFPNFKGSKWEKEGYKQMRNATVTTIAPTGTISIIAGCSSGIEPLFAISFVRNVMGGTTLMEVNQLFEKIARERGFYSDALMMEIAKKGSIQSIDGIPNDVKKIFVTAFDISPEWHVRMQAAFQKYTDNAVSKTVNLPNDATIGDVEKIYWMAYQMKCKGITIYRYGSKKEQVLYVTPVPKKKTLDKEYITLESEESGGCQRESCQV